MKIKKIAALTALALIPGVSFATNGYFAHGVGVKAKSMGGAGIAFSEDGFGIGANPATISQAAAGYAVGAALFAPDRGVTTSANHPTLPSADKDANEKKMFLVPEFAYVRHGGNGLSYGIGIYGNGGMNVDYGRAMYDNTRNTFANLEQLFIAPTISKKLNDQHAVALSLNVVYQTFEAGGLGWFEQYTRPATFLAAPGPGNPFGYSGGGVDPGDHGKDSSTGIGLKFGWTGQFAKGLTMGAFYQPKTRMSKFDQYKDLFAEDGKFDIPASFGLGLAFDATASTKVLFDVVKIKYADIKSLANRNNHNALDTKLGAADGKGFGWDDMTVYKLGVRHQMGDDMVIRAGWNYGKQPISNDQLDFNLLAPAVVEHHLTLGVSKKLDANSEITANYMHAFSKKVSGTPTQMTGTYYIQSLEMNQNEVGVQYSRKF